MDCPGMKGGACNTWLLSMQLCGYCTITMWCQAGQPDTGQAFRVLLMPKHEGPCQLHKCMHGAVSSVQTAYVKRVSHAVPSASAPVLGLAAPGLLMG